jgi:hypothetical protein
VLDANPWIAGTFDANKDLVHTKTGSDALVDDIMSLQRNAAVNRKVRYADLVSVTGSNELLTVQSGDQTRKMGSRVTKLVVVEPEPSGNASTPCEFAIIFSMSHAVADGHDYYRIFNMIAGNAPVEALESKRVAEYEVREAEWTGVSA